MMTATDTRLDVLRDQADALIRAELRGLEQRRNLERAVIEAITKMGATIDEVSAISGLTPAEIHKLLDAPANQIHEDLAALAGMV